MTKTLENIEIAEGLIPTSIGLIGRKNWRGKNGLLLKNANSIHTFGVRFPIDVVFLDNNYQVLSITENLKPMRVSPLVWKAQYVLELPSGSASKYSLKTGDTVAIAK